MTIIRTVPEDEAEGEVAALHAEERESLGYLPERLGERLRAALVDGL
jgi:hypothetical protein